MQVDMEKLYAQVREWMEHMHREPEVAMTEADTSEYIAGQLESMGYTLTRGIGKYGMVASLRVGDGEKRLGLRAEFDALPIQEENTLPYKSCRDGKAHLCGHDGHTAMLLGAARYLIETKKFKGTLNLIFQPAEETMEGGAAMVADGLFDRFPCDAIFAIHNIPGLEQGKLYFYDNQMMSAVDNWEIELTGKGTHGSMPETGVDPIVCGASLVMALQSIVSRNVSALEAAVVTVGAFLSGSAGNVVANSAVLRLSIRNMNEEVRKVVLQRIRDLTRTQAEGFGCKYSIREGVPGAVLMNDPAQTAWAAGVARATFGEDQVVYPFRPFMSSEDFAFMLQHRPGSYAFIGNGPGPMVHHPRYIFSQPILRRGVQYWIAIAENFLK